MDPHTSPSHPSLSSDQVTELTNTLYSNWIWRAVHALMSHQSFDSTIPWLVKHLNVSFEEVAEALEGLEKLNLVSCDKGVYRAEPWRQLVPDIQSTFERKLESHRITSEQLLNHMSAPEGHVGFYDSIYFSNLKLTKSLYFAVRDLIEKWEQDSKNLPEADAVYGLSFSTTNLTADKERTK